MTELPTANLFDTFKSGYTNKLEEEFSLTEYLTLCKEDPTTYATAPERMLSAIGEPTIINTADDPRLSRLFDNRELPIYPAFKNFYGAEQVVEQIVAYFKHAAQGLEERKQILYLLGPVGGGKSSLAEKLKELMELRPFYALKAGDTICPYFENPLNLFDPITYGERLEAEFGIPPRYLNGVVGAWTMKRLEEFNGDINQFTVVKLYPSKLKQIALAKTEPGDENNQDISALVGKTDIRKLEEFSQSDPDSYSYSGGLCQANQGMLEFVEMFKAPIKVLHPLLTATQEGNYKGTESISATPFDGVVLAHCFSDDTELLTEHGWRGKDDIDVGDVVATLNRDTGTIEYQPALNKFVDDNVTDMHHMSSSAADHLVTPNHKMIYQSYGTYKESLAEDFYVTGAKLPVSAVHQRPDLDLYSSLDELRFHIWCVTDGTVSYINKMGNMTYRFNLRKSRKIERLSELLTRLDMSFTVAEWKNSTCVTAKNVIPKFTKILTESHRQLSPQQVTTMLVEWSHTDGTRPETSRDNQFQLFTNVPFHKDLIQELATVSGHKTTCAANKKDGYLDVYALNVRLDTQFVRSDEINKGTVPYTGSVWCLETANHTLIARRNGKIIITGNSNESEWSTFKANKNNEAFIDRVYIVKVPYCTQYLEEIEIYKKLVRNSSLASAVAAPGTYEMMAKFAVLSRLVVPENSSIKSKMRVYNGENLKDTDPNAKSISEYKDNAGQDEAMSGISTRFAFKILSKVFNYDQKEIAANPVHLLYVLEMAIEREQFDKATYDKYMDFIKTILRPDYIKLIGDEVQKSYLESYSEYGQNMFEQYVTYADHWVQDKNFRDPNTGEQMNRQSLNEELEKIEKAGGIANPKDYRNDIVGWVIRHKASHAGDYPAWDAYDKMKKVIEKRMFAATEDILPIIAYGTKTSADDEKKHIEFVDRMVAKGYTRRHVRILCDWWIQVRKS